MGISGSVQDTKISFLCVYAPPPLSTDFVHVLEKVLIDVPSGIHVVGGDFNGVMDAILDRSYRGSVGSGSSSPLEGFARVDTFLIPTSECTHILHTRILARVLSDHSPVTLDIQMGWARDKWRWRLKPWLFKDPDFPQFIYTSVQQYLDENIGSVGSPSVLWEALKATVRRNIVSLSGGKKSVQRQEGVELETRALEIEAKYMETKDHGQLRNLTHTQSMIKQLYTEEARLAWAATRSHIYQWGDKSTKTLHWLCTRSQSSLPNSHILTNQGSIGSTDVQRVAAFREYYSVL